MSLEVVKKFAEESGNEELLGAVKGISDSMGANLDRISYLERELQSSIAKRDTQASLVKTKLGLEEISESALEAKIASLNNVGDEAFLAEKKNLEDLVATIKSEKDSLLSKYNDTVQSYRIDKQMNELGAAKEANGAKAYDLILNEVRKGATFENDGIIFKANDGTTIRNADGTPMSLADRYNQIKDSEEFNFLFLENKGKSGSGFNPRGDAGSSQLTSLAGLNDQQRVALYKSNPELFKKLSNKG